MAERHGDYTNADQTAGSLSLYDRDSIAYEVLSVGAGVIALPIAAGSYYCGPNCDAGITESFVLFATSTERRYWEDPPGAKLVGPTSTTTSTTASTTTTTSMTTSTSTTTTVPTGIGNKKPTLLALGDSYSAGVGGSGSPIKADCWSRPSISYSGQAVAKAKTVGREVDYTSHACLAAKTNDILEQPQPGTAQLKQLDYVSQAKPNIVTLTIGGNDIGFSKIPVQCVLNDVLIVLSCPVDSTQVILTDKKPEERESFDGLYDRLVKTYVEVRKAQGEGHLYVLSYPTFFERGALWSLGHLLPVARCNGFSIAQAREANKLSTRLGDTIFLAAQEANQQVGNVHFVDWRSKVITESQGFFGRTKVRNAYNSHGLCSRSDTWDINGLAGGDGKELSKDSFHPTEQGYRVAGDRLFTQMAKDVLFIP